jgi:hypothetical protein
MRNLLLAAVIALGISSAARADIHVVISIRNQTAWLLRAAASKSDKTNDFKIGWWN